MALAWTVGAVGSLGTPFTTPLLVPSSMTYSASLTMNWDQEQLLAESKGPSSQVGGVGTLGREVVSSGGWERRRAAAHPTPTIARTQGRSC